MRITKIKLIQNSKSLILFTFQIEFIDMHFGTGPGHLSALTDNDPYILNEHLDEIEICARDSKSIFFLVSFKLVFCDPERWAFQYEMHIMKVLIILLLLIGFHVTDTNWE